MGFDHRVIERDGHRSHELAEIESGYRIHNNLGAELVSLARRVDGGGRDGYLYRDGDMFELPGSFLLETLEADRYIIQLLDYAQNRQVEFDFFDVSYFTIWSDLNPFIGVEPCWGLPDQQEQQAFEAKLGIQIIPPQKTFTRRFSMRLN